MKNRAQLRGKPLDPICYKARRAPHEYGQSDDRVFCYGLEDRRTDEPLEQCAVCKAYVYNATPPKGVDA